MRRFAVILIAGALVMPAASAAATDETVLAGSSSADTDFSRLGTLGGPESVPTAVNDRGQVVGFSDTADGRVHAFLWDDGQMIDLAPDSVSSTAFDINDSGQVVFQTSDGAGGSLRSYLWHRGEVTSLGEVNARFVNERGQVAGTVFGMNDVWGLSSNPFLWNRGVRTDMEAVPFLGPDLRVVDFSDRGAVLGMGLGPESFELGFVWVDGILDIVGGDRNIFGGNGVVDINNKGLVLARDFGPNLIDQVFLWDSTRAVRFPVDLPPGQYGVAALNERGDVAVTLSPEDGGPDRALFWSRGQTSDVSAGGTLGSIAVDLNDRRQLAGFTRPQGGPTDDTLAFVWEDGVIRDLSGEVGLRTDVIAISEKGHVIGGATDETGTTQAYLWDTRSRGKG